MRKIVLPLVIASLMAGAAPVLAGWDEGVAAFGSKNFDRAIAEFQQLVTQDPDSWPGHYMLGLSLEQEHRPQEALDHLRKAVDLNPGGRGAKLALGRTYLALRRYGDVTELLAGIDASSLPSAQRVVFYQMRGKARMETGDAEGAAEDLAALAGLRPNDAAIRYPFGATLPRPSRPCAGQTSPDEPRQETPARGTAPIDLCDIGFEISRMTPCISAENCPAHELWSSALGPPGLQPAEPERGPEISRPSGGAEAAPASAGDDR